MANIKITDLTAYGNPTSTDVLPIVDVGADVTKKVSVADLLENAGSGTAAAPGIAFDGDSNTGIYRPGADQVGVTTGGTSKLIIDENGSLQVARGTKDNPAIYFDGGTGIYSPGADQLAISTNGSERARIDSDGRLLFGTSGTPTCTAVFAGRNDAASSAPIIRLDVDNASPVDGEQLGNLYFGTTSDVAFNSGARITARRDGGTWTANTSLPTRLEFLTTNDGESSPTRRMRIDSNGETHFSRGGATEGDEALSAGSLTTASIRVFTVTAFGNSTLAAAAWFRKNSSTGRSINAGGTVNASGADYAEYMTKAGDFTIAKGDICGIDFNGKLTNVFANAVGFVVKSTDPSYVGGDSWGADIEDPVQLKTERQKVDRIAFAGQVPVNVTNANPGQYIVPIETDDGGIAGTAKDEANLTLAEYIRAVGKVIAIEDDGRARIIVKVA